MNNSITFFHFRLLPSPWNALNLGSSGVGVVAAGAGDEDADGGAAGSPYFLRFFPKTGTVGLDEEDDDAAGALVVAVAADVEVANGLLLNMEDALGEDDKLVVPVVVVVFVERTGLPSNRRPSPVNA